MAIIIPEGAHHLDLRANNAFDPMTVLLARSLEVKYMKQWIRDFYAYQRKNPWATFDHFSFFYVYSTHIPIHFDFLRITTFPFLSLDLVAQKLS